MIEGHGRGGFVVVQLVVQIAETVANPTQGEFSFFRFLNYFMAKAFHAVHQHGIDLDAVDGMSSGHSETEMSAIGRKLGNGVVCDGRSFLFCGGLFFWGSRLKKCSKPMPLDTTKLVAEFRLVLMTELSDSECEL